MLYNLPKNQLQKKDTCSRIEGGHGMYNCFSFKLHFTDCHKVGIFLLIIHYVISKTVLTCPVFLESKEEYWREMETR